MKTKTAKLVSMSTNPLSVMVLTCSSRPGALGPTIATWFADAASSALRELNVELVHVSLADLDLPFLDEEEHPASGRYAHEHTRRWSAIVDSVDAVVAITPEYNYGMPATLKNALDYLGREWAWKPISFVSYGNTSAGTRSVQHAKQVVTTLRLVPTGATVAMRISDAIDRGLVRPDEARDAAARSMLAELAHLSRALRPMRAAIHPAAELGPISGSYVRRLQPDDAAEVTVLQRCSWVDEALVNSTLEIPALHESLDEVNSWLATWQAWGVFIDGRLLAMVRARRVDNDWHIGRLAVVPDLRRAGLGRWLLRHAEGQAPSDCDHAVLTTGSRSTSNLNLYRSEGYEKRMAPEDAEALHIVLGKVLNRNRAATNVAPDRAPREAVR